ncbi:MAG: hypothetical protein L6R40_003129 [Gallowayella cf. fulva]|nr:MAG: hypothetical protein L6R40_003129 [Xanthomendoza cf. fulva]
MLFSCLRAFFPTQSPAVYSSDAAFCATYTTTVNTQTTGFPSRATAACGTAPARYSSACSCKPTLTSTLVSSTKSSTTTSTASVPTCTPGRPFNDAVTNGGFECGLSPWIAQDATNSIHAITSPGDASNFAYEFQQRGPLDSTSNPASISQDLILTSGVPYNLKFRTYFDRCTNGPSDSAVGIQINFQNVNTVNACKQGPGGVFRDGLYQFYATSDATKLRLQFFAGRTDAVIKIDNISVVPLH